MAGPIALGTIRTTGVFTLRLFFQAGHLLVVARLLGPDQFGLFAATMALAVMIGTLSTLGTQYLLLEATALDPSAERSVLSYAVPTTLVVGGVLLALFVPTTHFMLTSDRFFGPLSLLLIGAAELVVLPLLTLSTMGHLGHGRIAMSQLIRTMPLGLRFVVALVLLGAHPAQALPIYASFYLLVSIVSLFIAQLPASQRMPSVATWRRPTLVECQRASGFAVMSLTASGPTEVDKAIAPRLLSAHMTSVYALAARIIGALMLPVLAMMLSALPRLFQSTTGRRSISDNRLLAYTITCALGYSTLLASLLWYAAPFVHVVFGPEYTAIKDVLRVFCLAVPGMALRIVVASTLISLGKPWTRVAFEVLGIVLLVLVAVSLVNALDVLALVLATTISEWIMGIGGLAIALHARTSLRSKSTN